MRLRPNVFDYMDVRQFLQDFFQHRKGSDPTFSYGKWTTALGFNNKTLLRMILQGKRNISEKSRAQIKKYMNFDNQAAEYFDVLVDYCQAKKVSQKQGFGQRLIQIQRKNFSQPEINVESGILEDAYGPLILTLISSASSSLSEKDLISQLSLDPARVRNVLNKLCEFGLVEDKFGQLNATHSTFKIADHFGAEGLRNFYNHWLRQSIAAIDLPFELRRFRSLQLLLSKQEFEDLNKNFQEFVVSSLSRLEKNTLENRRLYIMNSALFPVTDEL